MSEQYPLSVALTCRDMAASLAFYRDQLGFTMKESWPSADSPLWANLVLDGQSVMLGAHMSVEDAVKMCGGDEQKKKWAVPQAEAFAEHPAGVGINVYVQVPEVDAYHARIRSLGAKPETEPATQFYGIRDFGIVDPDGYRLTFYTAVAMSECQSCGMPLADAKPGQMYCQYCTDDDGRLRPYESVLEGTIQGYFMGMQKMPRDKAEKAAKEHLAKMPAWAGRD